MNILNRFLKKNKTRIIIGIFLFLMVSLAYGETIKMFYWIDDWGMLFNMIHPDIFPGNFGNPAYRYNTTPFVLLYPFVGLNAQVYFGLGVLQYFLATIALLLLVKKITKNLAISTSIATVFASGYIGSYAMYRISNSYQLVDTAIFMLLTATSLILSYKTKKSIFYFTSLILFVLTLEFFLLRSQALLPVILTISILFGNYKFKKGDIYKFSIKHLPFGLIYYYFYFLDERISPGGSNSSNYAFRSTINTIFNEHNFELLNNLLVSLTNILVPQKVTQFISTSIEKQLSPAADSQLIAFFLPALITTTIILIYWIKSKADKAINAVSITVIALSPIFIYWSTQKITPLWNPNRHELTAAAVGLVLIELSIWMYLLFRKKEENAAKLLLLGLAWSLSVVFTYFIYTPSTNLDSTSRYLIPGFVGSAIFYVSFFQLFPKLFIKSTSLSKTVSIFFTSLTCLVLLSWGRADQKEIVKTISAPSRSQFQSLQKELKNKELPQESAFLFETINNSVLRGNILGGMPHVAVAIAAEFGDGAQIADSYEHLTYLIDSGKVKIENVYTFFAPETGLINTTSGYRDLMQKPQPSKSLSSLKANIPILNLAGQVEVNTKTYAIKKGMIGINPIIEIDTDSYPSYTPIELTLSVKATPISPNLLKFPYYDYTSKLPTPPKDELIENIKPENEVEVVRFEEIRDTLSFESDRASFYKAASVKVTSEGKQTEATNLLDNRLDTNWSAYDANWNGGERPEEIVLDLGKVTHAEKLYWVNHYPPATPSEYTISYMDGSGRWQDVLRKQNGLKLEGKTISSEELGGVTARYIKFSIFDTYAGLGYPPAIEEIWVTGIKKQANPAHYSEILQCIYCYVEGKEQAVEINSYLHGVAKARISWVTNSSGDYQTEYSKDLGIFVDGREVSYKIIIPPKGTQLEKIRIDNFSLPVNLTIKDVKVKTLTFEEVKSNNLIKAFAK